MSRQRSTPAARLAEAGIKIPEPPPASGTYRSVSRHHRLLWVSGQPPRVDGVLIAFGAMTQANALRACLQVCTLNVLGQLNQVPGGIDRIEAVVYSKVVIAVNPGDRLDPSVAHVVQETFAVAFEPEGAGVVSLIGSPGLPGQAPAVVESMAILR